MQLNHNAHAFYQPALTVIQSKEDFDPLNRNKVQRRRILSQNADFLEKVPQPKMIICNRNIIELNTKEKIRKKGHSFSFPGVHSPGFFFFPRSTHSWNLT